MGTRHETYLMLAVRLDFAKVTDDMNTDASIFDKLSVPYRGKNSIGKMGILVDGMDGEYAIAGLVLAVADDEGNGMSLTTISIEEESKQKVRDWVEASQLLSVTTDETPELMIVTHFH